MHKIIMIKNVTCAKVFLKLAPLSASVLIFGRLMVSSERWRKSSTIINKILFFVALEFD